MGTERILKTKLTPEVAAERKRVLDVIGTLVDRELELHDSVCVGDKFLVGLFASDLAHLAKVVRDGGDGFDLDELLSKRAAVREKEPKER